MDEYFCPNCGATLNDQAGFTPSIGSWTCTACGMHLMDADVYEGDTYEGVAWYCDECGALLNRQLGFSDSYGSWICTECGHVNGTNENDILNDGFHEKSNKLICPNCGKILNDQSCFNEYADDWICTECGSHLHHSYSDDPYSVIDDEGSNKLTCPNCGEALNNQFCFNKYDDDWVCTLCGAHLHHSYSDDSYSIVENDDEDDNDYNSYESDFQENHGNGKNAASRGGSSERIFSSRPKTKPIWLSFFRRRWKGTFLGALILFAAAIITFIMVEYQKLTPMGYSYDELIGMNYETVVANLDASGFTNVRTESIEDLDISEIAAENLVYEIEILGKSSFDSDTKYPYDIKITIKYHTLKLVTPPLSDKETKGENYLNIIAEFEDAGFINIRTETKYDIVLGWFAKDGEVESVAIGGEKTFDTTTAIRPDTEIMIAYHTYKSNAK